MKYLLIASLFFSGNICFAQTRIDNMTAKLRQANFGEVYSVKDSLVNRQKAAIPKLIELLKDTSFVKLVNTADLIYPGADKFYGHGWIVNYDLDWVPVRAAWLLEKITFQDFGYQNRSITEGDLMALHKRDYANYLHTGSHSIDYKDKTPEEKLKAYRVMLADSVAKWWDKNKATWSRFAALKEALASSSEYRQSLALQYLRSDKTRCDGLSLVSYEAELKQLVLKIKNSTSRKADQAGYLLDDKEYYWFTSKTER